MCKCLKTFQKGILQILNLLHVIFGIILLGFMTYVMINYASLLPEVGIGLGINYTILHWFILIMPILFSIVQYCWVYIY